MNVNGKLNKWTLFPSIDSETTRYDRSMQRTQQRLDEKLEGNKIRKPKKVPDTMCMYAMQEKGAKRSALRSVWIRLSL